MPDSESQLTIQTSTGESANALVRAQATANEVPGDDPAAEVRDTRLDRLPMALHVMVKVERMRVEDLLALERGTVLATVHEHSQDVPVRCGGALLLWGEFEVVEQTLAVRVTRLA